MRQMTVRAICIGLGIILGAAGWALGAPFVLAITAAALWAVAPFLPGRWRLAPPLIAPIILAAWRPEAGIAAWQTGALAAVFMAAWLPFWAVQGDIPWRRLPLALVFVAVPILSLAWFAPSLFGSDVAVRAQAIALVLLTVLALVASRAWQARQDHLPR